jgi:hypothetical protein
MIKRSKILILSLVVVFLLTIAYILNASRIKTTQQEMPTQTSTSVLLTDEEVIINLFEDSLIELGLPLEQNEEYRVEGIEKQGEWAFISATLIDSVSGEPFVGELAIFLFRKTNHEWAIAFPGTDLYKNWLEEFPETLLSSNVKMFLR